MATEGEFVIRVPAREIIDRLEKVEASVASIDSKVATVDGKVDQVIKSQEQASQIRATVKVAKVGRSGQILVASIAAAPGLVALLIKAFGG